MPDGLITGDAANESLGSFPIVVPRRPESNFQAIVEDTAQQAAQVLAESEGNTRKSSTVKVPGHKVRTVEEFSDAMRNLFDASGTVSSVHGDRHMDFVMSHLQELPQWLPLLRTRERQAALNLLSVATQTRLRTSDDEDVRDAICDLIQHYPEDVWNLVEQDPVAFVRSLQSLVGMSKANDERILDFLLNDERLEEFQNLTDTVIGTLLYEKGSTVKAEALEAVADVMTDAGLDPEYCTDAWGDAFDNCPEESFALNMFALEELEDAEPGAAKVLNDEFGIINFGRYNLHTLLDQYDNRDDTDSPYGIVAYPAFDETGAFFRDGRELLNFQDDLQQFGARMRIYEAGSKTGLARILLSSSKRYDSPDAQDSQRHKLSFMVLGGHGAADSIGYGIDESDDLHTDDLNGASSTRLKQFFEGIPEVILYSCNTGLEGGIAEQMQQLGANVTAPDKEVGHMRIEVDKNDDRLSFSVRYDDEEGVVRKAA